MNRSILTCALLAWLAPAAALAQGTLTFLDDQGEPTASFPLGAEVNARLVHPESNGNPSGVDQVFAQLNNLTSYEAEYLSLVETGPDTGIFLGSMPLRTGAIQSYNQVLTGSPGDQIRASLGDLQATADLVALAVRFVDAQGAPVAAVPEEDPAQVWLLNVFANLDPGIAETAYAEIEARFTTDSESLTLTETGPDTNVFRGSIPLERAPSGGTDGILQVFGSLPSGDQPEELTARYGTTSVTVLTIPAGPPNRAPEPVYDLASILEDQSVTIPVLANDIDPDGDILIVAAVTQPGLGVAVIDPGASSVTFTPAPNANGSADFLVTVRDPDGLEATSPVLVSIAAVNDPPAALDDAASTLQDTPVLVEILANDSDIDSEVFYPVSVTAPAHGTAQSQMGTILYTPSPGFSGVDTFSYTLVDGSGATDTATVTVTVTPVTPPRVTADLQVLYELEEGSGTTVADTSGVGAPLPLTIGNPAAVTWIPGGLSVDAPTLLQSAVAATKVVNAVKATHSITLEAWVEPASVTQTGPAPIVTVSQTASIRNFTLGQSGNRWEARVRTSNTNPNGYGHLAPVGSATLQKTHVVYTRDASTTVKMYVNGVQVLSGYVTGTFATWPTTQKLGLAAELNGANPWLGKLYLVAVYNRALTAAEVEQNWLAGE